MSSIHVSRPINLRTTGTLITTRQAINSTKTTTTRSVYPGNSRPNVNGPATSSTNDYIGPVRKARPLKIWRKQLQPVNPASRTKVTIGLINAPGGIVFRGSDCGCGTAKNLYVTEDIFEPKIKETLGDVKLQNPGYVQVGDPSLPTSYQINTGVFETKTMSSCPQTRIIKSARSKISRAYYGSTAAYLQARCKTVQQKLSRAKVPGISYYNGTTPVYPSNSATGSQVFYTTNCSNGERVYPLNPSAGCREVTIHKPNNLKFGVQGAVSAGTRLARLKLDTITKNGASFRTAYGDAAANAGKYHGDMGSPYFIKNKVNFIDCGLYRRVMRRPVTAC
jgi:hypothetical protein